MPEHTLIISDEHWSAVEWAAQALYQRTDTEAFLDDTVVLLVLDPFAAQKKAAEAPAAPLDITVAYTAADPAVQEEVRVLLGVEPAPPTMQESPPV